MFLIYHKMKKFHIEDPTDLCSIKINGSGFRVVSN